MPYYLTIFQYHPAYFRGMLQAFLTEFSSAAWLNLEQQDYVLDDISQIPLPQTNFPYGWDRNKNFIWYIHGVKLESLFPDAEACQDWFLQPQSKGLNHPKNFLTILQQTYSWSIFPWDRWSDDVPFVCLEFISSNKKLHELFFETISKIRVFKEVIESLDEPSTKASTNYYLSPLISDYFVKTNFEAHIRGVTFGLDSYDSYSDLGNTLWDICENRNSPWLITDLYPGSYSGSSDSQVLTNYCIDEEGNESTEEYNYDWSLEDFNIIHRLRINQIIFGIPQIISVPLAMDVIQPKNKRTLSRMCREFTPAATELVLIVSANADLVSVQEILGESVVHYPHMEPSLSYFSNLLEATEWFCWLATYYECGFFSRNNLLLKKFLNLHSEEKYRLTAFF